jgi:hypothetical protein
MECRVLIQRTANTAEHIYVITKSAPRYGVVMESKKKKKIISAEPGEFHFRYRYKYVLSFQARWMSILLKVVTKSRFKLTVTATPTASVV